MKAWNEKYGIDHDELEEKIFKLSEELKIMPHEAEFELENLKEQYEDWNVDKLISEIKKEFREGK